LENKGFDITDARCNHEIHAQCMLMICVRRGKLGHLISQENSKPMCVVFLTSRMVETKQVVLY